VSPATTDTASTTRTPADGNRQSLPDEVGEGQSGTGSGDHTHPVGSADSSSAEHGSSDAYQDNTPSSGLTADTRNEILETEKGSRPDPSDYLSPNFIEWHAQKFNDGATRFMLEESFQKYGISQRDGTSFVFPTSEIDRLMETGSYTALENALGLPEGYFDNYQILRVDVPDPSGYNLRIPSGNEAGANEYWIPGGLLPEGVPEAVIDGSKVPPEDLITTDFDLPNLNDSDLPNRNDPEVKPEGDE